MLDRLTAAAESVPELRQYVSLIEDRYRKLADETDRPCSGCTATCISGQVLRTPERWLLIDFEGEPGQPLERAPSPRFAAARRGGHGAVTTNTPPTSGWWSRQPTTTGTGSWPPGPANGWSATARVVLRGLRGGGRRRPRATRRACSRPMNWTRPVYEAAYEARHRPSWLPIPLKSIAR